MKWRICETRGHRSPGERREIRGPRSLKERVREICFVVEGRGVMVCQIQLSFVAHSVVKYTLYQVVNRQIIVAMVTLSSMRVLESSFLKRKLDRYGDGSPNGFLRLLSAGLALRRSR